MANKENLSKWVRALVSGEYKQGQGSLRTNGAFCCLGVACDISGVGAWQYVPSGVSYVVGEDRSWSSMPLPVVEWLGLEEDITHGNPRLATVDDGDRNHYAATLNDSLGANFRYIAEAIVRTYDLDPALLEEGNDDASEV